MTTETDPAFILYAAMGKARDAVKECPTEPIPDIYQAFIDAETAFVSAQPTTLEGLALQLRHAVQDELCGTQRADGLDKAMFERAAAMLDAAHVKARAQITAARLQGYALGAGVAPVDEPIASDDTPTDALMDFCDQHNLTLDWCILGADPARRQAA